LGGKLRTGEPTEFVLALAVLAISFFLGWCRVGVGGGCLFVRADWCSGYHERVEIGGQSIRLVSPKEMRENRFSF
ncbi:hypothetical protein, partial [Thermovibrio ammonificans]